MRKQLDSQVFRQKHSKPACAMPTYSTFTNMPMTSLLALLTINNGIGVNVYHYQKAETCRTGTNGVASCSWMCSVMNKTKTGTKFQFGGTQDLGCHDGLSVLKTMLNLRKNHNLLSHMALLLTLSMHTINIQPTT